MIRKVCLGIVVLLALVSVVSAQTLLTEPYPLEVAVGGSGNLDLILDTAPNGFKSYGIVLKMDDNASISGITLPDWCQFTEIKQQDNLWYIQCLDTNDEITAGATNVVLATISVTGVNAGSADLFIQTTGDNPWGYALYIRDDNNQDMFPSNVSIDNAVEVTTTTPTPTPTEVLEDKDVIFEDKTNPNVPIELTLKSVDVDLTNYTVSIKYGENLEFTIDVPEKATVKLVDLKTGEAIWTEQITGYKEFELDTVGLGIKPSEYTIRISASYGGETNDLDINDASSYTKVKVAGVEYSPANFKLVVEPEEVGKPVVTLTLKNPSNRIAKGDIVRYEIEVYGAEQGTYTVEGPFDNSAYKDVMFTVTDHKYTIVIDTNDILKNWNGSTGAYKLKVKSGDTEETATFYIVGVTVTVSVDKDEVRLGESFTVSGSTNVAETNSDYDDSVPNKVTIKVYSSTTEEPEYLVSTYETDVEEDGSFSKEIDTELSWDTGTYKVVAEVCTNADYCDDDSIILDVKKPELEITMDSYSLARGESFKVKGTTSLPAGTEVIIEGLDEFSDGSSKEKVLVDTEGKFESKEFHVNPDAGLATYTIKAYVYRPGTTEKLVEDSVTIKVVRQSIDVNIDKTVVARGGKIVINGTTTVDTVYIYAEEKGIFEDVAELPYENEPFPIADYPTKAVDVDDGKFEATLKVKRDADTGTYLLYIFAPASTEEIDPVSDAQKIFAIQIVDACFAEVPEKITMVRGQDVDIKIKVDAPDPDETVYVEWKLEGQGIKTDEIIEYPDEEGVVEITLYPFYDKSSKTLTSDNGKKLLAVGTYTLTFKLYYQDTNEEVEDAEKKVILEVVPPEIDVSYPEEVAKGDQLVVTVNTNRAEGYEYIYVILKAPMKIYRQKVTTDENGTARAVFETAGLSPGEYKIYVRDTMGTESPDFDWDIHYGLSPTDGAAIDLRADDDILWVGEIKIVEAVVTTPTPTTPPPTTPPPTTPAPTTPTPTTPPPTTPTTPPPTTTTPSPGFEAVFAIAGLLAIAYLLRRRQ